MGIVGSSPCSDLLNRSGLPLGGRFFASGGPKWQKPNPVVVTTICSLCDEPWEDHGDKPTTEDCIRLLKAKLFRNAQTIIYRDRWIPQPYVVPTPRPYWQEPTWTGIRVTSASNTSSSTMGAITVNSPLPRLEVDKLTPLQRAEAFARRHFPHAKIDSSFGSVIHVTSEDLPPYTSILVCSPKVKKK